MKLVGKKDWRGLVMRAKPVYGSNVPVWKIQFNDVPPIISQPMMVLAK